MQGFLCRVKHGREGKHEYVPAWSASFDTELKSRTQESFGTARIGDALCMR